MERNFPGSPRPSADDIAAQPRVAWGPLVLVVPLVAITWMLAARLWTWSPVDYANLAFHEFGHLAFAPFGSTMHFLGGTLMQLLVPTLLVLHFLVRQRQPLGAAFCLWWIGENLINIGIYMADARDLALPLVGGGDHDWNNLFFRWGTLTEPAVDRISGTTHLSGRVVMILALIWIGALALPIALRLRICEPILRRWPAFSSFLNL